MNTDFWHRLATERGVAIVQLESQLQAMAIERGELIAALDRFCNCGITESDGHGGERWHSEFLGAFSTARTLLARVQS